MNEPFDVSRVFWEKNRFKPWYLKQAPIRITDMDFDPNEEMIVVELGGVTIGFIQREVVYHHVVQGYIENTPFLLTFCGVCNTGILLSPVVDGKIYHFRETGVYNGQQIFEDIETNSLWNHLTGEGLYGSLQGKNLEIIGFLRMSTFGAEKQSNPDLLVYLSGEHKIYQNVMHFVIKVILGRWNKNWLPPHFEKTIPEIDNSLPKMTMGLAVKVKNIIRFYPMDAIKNGLQDTIENETIALEIENKIPVARNLKGDYPFQLFTRWYAYVITYPQGELYKR